jgi:hypothetical protein
MVEHEKAKTRMQCAPMEDAQKEQWSTSSRIREGVLEVEEDLKCRTTDTEWTGCDG